MKVASRAISGTRIGRHCRIATASASSAMNTSSPVARPTFLMACSLVAATLLAGCHATTDARWTTANDTVYHWERALPTLPVEVRGRLPDATNEQIVQAIPRARAASQAAPASTARLIVDAGSDAVPQGDSYCVTDIPPQASSPSRAPLALNLALCDGTRLVATSRSLVPSGRSGVEDLPRQIARLKNLMLIGIDESPSQYVHIQS